MNYTEKRAIRAAQQARRTITKKMLTYIATGFGLVAGLAWNEAIKTLLDYLIPDAGNSVLAKIIYAMVVTIFVGIVLWGIEKFSHENKEK